MASIGPDVPAHLLARNAAESESAAEQPEAGPSIGPPISAQTTPAPVTIAPPPVPPVPRYEEEEDEDDYVPELPPDLAAARAKPAAGGPPRRTIGPAWGPFRREEEEEESEDEIGPAPPPPPLHAGAGSSDARAREDAVTEFMQKEELRRQAIEVRSSSFPPLYSPLRVFPTRACTCARVNVLISASAPQEAARPKILQREEWMLVPPTSSDLLSSASLSSHSLRPCHLSVQNNFNESTPAFCHSCFSALFPFLLLAFLGRGCGTQISVFIINTRRARSNKAEQTAPILPLDGARQSRRQLALDGDARGEAAAPGGRGDGQEASRRERGPGPGRRRGGRRAETTEARGRAATAGRGIHGA
jgi:hypothetical protein